MIQKQINTELVDHLFRHQYGKMVSILTRIFGLTHLETIEDAIQDTFLQASQKWREGAPPNPEAWLTKAAKYRVIDLLRKLKTDRERHDRLAIGPAAIAIDQMFLEGEIEDAQLRMIFTACHPALNQKDQIAFALKTIAGFSQNEIAASLLLKQETVKKRLSRARKHIQSKEISFEIPSPHQLPGRLERVLEVLYLIFNEGFHSSQKEILIRQDLCGEALRLIQILLKKPQLRTGSCCALFALMCFHSARLESKTDSDGNLIPLQEQDRKLWYRPLVDLGKSAMASSKQGDLASYHYEALIALEHLEAANFEGTNWRNILSHYEQLYALNPNPFVRLNMAIVRLQLEDFEGARLLLDGMEPEDLEQRAYLLYSTRAKLEESVGEVGAARREYKRALESVENEKERQFIHLRMEDLGEKTP